MGISVGKRSLAKHWKELSGVAAIDNWELKLSSGFNSRLDAADDESAESSRTQFGEKGSLLGLPVPQVSHPPDTADRVPST